MKMAIRTASTNSVDPDLGCSSRTYFDFGTLTLQNVTMTSQNHANTITSVIAAKQMVINEVDWAEITFWVIIKNGFLYD